MTTEMTREGVTQRSTRHPMKRSGVRSRTGVALTSNELQERDAPDILAARTGLIRLIGQCSTKLADARSTRVGKQQQSSPLRELLFRNVGSRLPLRPSTPPGAISRAVYGLLVSSACSWTSHPR